MRISILFCVLLAHLVSGPGSPTVILYLSVPIKEEGMKLKKLFDINTNEEKTL